MLILAMLMPKAISIQRSNRSVVVENGRLRLEVDRRRGVYELAFSHGRRIRAIDSVVRLRNGTELRASAYSTHEVAASDIQTTHDKLGDGTRVTVHHRAPNLPELRQVFWIYRGRNEAIVEIDVSDRQTLESNYMAPIATKQAAAVSHNRLLKSLFVPYDNDAYVRYRTDCWATTPDDMGSNEVGAVFDDTSREGLIIGSIGHDLWKSGVRFTKSNDQRFAGVTAFAGARGPKSQRQVTHGTVSGKNLRSPRFVVGWYSDWRAGLERYGALNAKIQPPMPWYGGVPVGWNSWAGHKNKLHAADADAAIDFLVRALPDLRNDGTAYVNLDSYWDNLSRGELVAFVRNAHNKGLKAGIYWTPFTAWGELNTPVAGDRRYRYSDLVLKDEKGGPMPKFSGGYPLDPTHPGTLARIDRELSDFVTEGFDFVKLDFVTDGAVEGRHFDKSIQTGTVAYRVGMQRIRDDLSPKKVGRPFFISLSIAPLFPQGYGHSRRISCDAFANIGSSEYLLNSASYGWWTSRTLYAFNDPDSACVYQPLSENPVTEAEGRTRFTASVISGGMLFEGDNLMLEPARKRVSRLFSNHTVLAVARLGLAFRPLEAAEADRSATSFYAIDPRSRDIFVAAFNYSRDRELRTEIPLTRLPVTGNAVRVRDLWTQTETVAWGSVKIELAPMSCVFLRLSRRISRVSPPPMFVAGGFRASATRRLGLATRCAHDRAPATTN